LEGGHQDRVFVRIGGLAVDGQDALLIKHPGDAARAVAFVADFDVLFAFDVTRAFLGCKVFELRYDSFSLFE
jgi:hypothetical protein